MYIYMNAGDKKQTNYVREEARAENPQENAREFKRGCFDGLNENPVKHITIRGHGGFRGKKDAQIPIYGSSGSLTEDGYTVEEFYQKIIDFGLPESVERIDIIGCNIGLEKPNKPSFAQQLVQLMAENPKYKHIEWRAFTYKDEKNEFEAMSLIRNTSSVELYRPSHDYTRCRAFKGAKKAQENLLAQEKSKKFTYEQEIAEKKEQISELKESISKVDLAIQSAEEQDKQVLQEERKKLVKPYNQLVREKNILVNNKKEINEKIKQLKIKITDYDNKIDELKQKVQPETPYAQNIDSSLSARTNLTNNERFIVQPPAIILQASTSYSQARVPQPPPSSQRIQAESFVSTDLSRQENLQGTRDNNTFQGYNFNN